MSNTLFKELNEAEVLTDEDLKFIKFLLLKNNSNQAKRISDKIETSHEIYLLARFERHRKI